MCRPKNSSAHMKQSKNVRIPIAICTIISLAIMYDARTPRKVRRFRLPSSIRLAIQMGNDISVKGRTPIPNATKRYLSMRCNPPPDVNIAIRHHNHNHHEQGKCEGEKDCDGNAHHNLKIYQKISKHGRSPSPARSDTSSKNQGDETCGLFRVSAGNAPPLLPDLHPQG